MTKKQSVARVRRICLAILVIAVTASPAIAQTQGWVVREGAVILRADASVVAAKLVPGIVLEITAQSPRWYEVVIPERLGGRGERGLVAKDQLRLLAGSQEPPMRELPARSGAAGVNKGPGATQLSGPPSPSQSPRGRHVEPLIGVRAFGQAAYTFFTARKSLDAILGNSGGPSFGAGAEVRFANGLFAQASWERFQQTGQRVFVFEETVFPLGIPDTITITPIVLSGGYRVARSSMVVPYFGGGIGWYRFTETSPFSDGEFNELSTGYQAIGGLEFRLSRWAAIASEGQYTWVPDGLGLGGVSEVFNERNLGGSQFRIKLLFGR